MATHCGRLTDDLNLALAFAALGLPGYPATHLSVETLAEFKKLVDERWAEKLSLFQKARGAWAAQYNATLLKEQALAVAQSKLDVAEARAERDANAWERLEPSEQETSSAEHERRTAKTEATLAKLRAAAAAAQDVLVEAERMTTALRKTFDFMFGEMMDARAAEELARALPAVWAGDDAATAWFERSVTTVKAYRPNLRGLL